MARMQKLNVLPSGLKETITDTDSGLEIRIYYLECLAQATYLILHEDNALIVDPRRDVEAFVQELATTKKTLKGVLETHFHADFVSGHLELKERTGCTVYFGPTAAARCKFEMHELQDGETIPFSSRYDVKVLHTPGHTPESVVYILVDRQHDNTPLKAFTGDTLFIGSCGRPDLVGSIGFTAKEMARTMFYTLLDKITTLPDNVQVFPAHGAGSPCGKNLSSDLHSTIGKEKRTNPALQFTDVNAFVDFLTTGQPASPDYFSHDVGMNIAGAPDLTEELGSICRAPPQEFMKMCESNKYPIVDTRPVEEFNRGHIQSSINVPLGGSGGAIVGVQDGNFAMWVGTLFSCEGQLLLVCNPESIDESLQRLARIGYTNVLALLEGGMCSWEAEGLPTMTNTRIDLNSNPNIFKTGEYTFVDVRTAGEYDTNTCQGAIHLPLTDIYKKLDLLERTKKYVVLCKSGYRSVIGSSILRAEGYNATDVFGGFASISVKIPEITTTKQVCPSMKAMVAEFDKISS